MLYCLHTVIIVAAVVALLAGCERTGDPDVHEPAADVPTEGKNPIVILETTRGRIVVELWPDKAPKTVANFLQYVDDGFYDGTIFHRVIDGFMIQGGGFTPQMQTKPTRAPIPNEARSDVANLRGTLAMARTSDPHSATAQFFINHTDNANLDKGRCPDGYGYCAFGKVVGGMDVVDAIATARTASRPPYDDVPAEDIVILRATRP